MDSNVIVSATLLPQSVPGKIIQLWYDDQFTLITSQYILKEVEYTLLNPKVIKKYQVTHIDISSLLNRLNQYSILVNPTTVDITRVRDPKDTLVLITAIQGHTRYLVSGDKDILVLSTHKSIKPLKIITPTEFLHLFD